MRPPQTALCAARNWTAIADVVAMLEFHALKETRAPPGRLVELLQAFKTVLATDGMASMDEYGDMLKWALPGKDGICRYFHVFHPDYCSFGDQFFGTIHYHGGWIRGTVLLGHMEHYTYAAKPTPDGDRFLAGQSYQLTKHTHQQGAGTSYELPAMVPHWLKPTELTLTYFEEEDNERMGDLVNPATTTTDEHVWEQEHADALLPGLLTLIQEHVARLTVVA